MNTKSEINPAALLALRPQPDAPRLIADLLRVRDMGPADHIRTKHEVKLFMATGALKEAEALVTRAGERRAATLKTTLTAELKQQRGQRLSP